MKFSATLFFLVDFTSAGVWWGKKESLRISITNSCIQSFKYLMRGICRDQSRVLHSYCRRCLGTFGKSFSSRTWADLVRFSQMRHDQQNTHGPSLQHPEWNTFRGGAQSSDLSWEREKCSLISKQCRVNKLRGMKERNSSLEWSSYLYRYVSEL